jgi:hypothetical protein
LTVFVPLFRLACRPLLAGVFPSLLGKKATLWLAAPFTLMSAYLSLLSPFSYLILMVVLVVALLDTLANSAVPVEEPPIYPAAADPEHPEQDTLFAPPESVAASPS